jgi:hypothetical protein
VCETWSLSQREEYKLRVFESRVLRRIFGPKRAEVSGGWRRLHNEELHNLYTSPNTRVIKCRRMRWVGHVASIGDMRNAYIFLLENVKGKDHSENLGIDGKILEWILGEKGGKV